MANNKKYKTKEPNRKQLTEKEIFALRRWIDPTLIGIQPTI